MPSTGPHWRVSRRRGFETLCHDHLIEERLNGETGPLHFGLDDLTATEERVAGLVGEGLTNRGVAQNLYMSPYTKDSDLLGKAGPQLVRNREMRLGPDDNHLWIPK